jgi:hypothetical protein
MTENRVMASFRDPDGFIYTENGVVYRQVNHSYKNNYDCLMESGLYDCLIKSELLIPHKASSVTKDVSAYLVLEPEQIDFISYPYEWCFGQLKDAALTTLAVQKMAIEFGMSLKDASAYNIQFRNGKPVFIDTLSFEKYCEGKPWVAYGQFCEHFLTSLALMKYRDIRLNQLLRVYIDGVPLSLASSLLPLWLNPMLQLHIRIHSLSQKRYAIDPFATKRIGKRVSRNSLLGIISSLESAVESLNWRPKRTGWLDYYTDNNYTADASNHKRQIVSDYLDQIRPKSVWDIGTNTGLFSRTASDKGIPTISTDVDPACVEVNYRSNTKNILPLVLDLTNPSPRIGWRNQERLSFLERVNVDTVLALAIIHHLAISNNVPLDDLVDFFKGICHWLIIEFVPRDDPSVRLLLAAREDTFPDYAQSNFENKFLKEFYVRDCIKVKDTNRLLYLMEKRS